MIAAAKDAKTHGRAGIRRSQSSNEVSRVFVSTILQDVGSGHTL